SWFSFSPSPDHENAPSSHHSSIAPGPPPLFPGGFPWEFPANEASFVSRPSGPGAAPMVDHRVVHRTSPLARQERSLFIRTSQSSGKGQFLFQGRTHLLMRLEPPLLFDGTAPHPIPSILALPDSDLNHPGDGAQMHPLFSPVPCFSSAEGEKLRLGGQLLPVIFLPAVFGSIPGLRPALPFQSRGANASLPFLNSLVSFLELPLCLLFRGGT